MKKASRALAILFVLVLLSGLIPAALAEDAPVSSAQNELPDWYPEDPSSFTFFHNDFNTPRVIDNADIFTDEEEARLESLIRDIVTVYDADIVIYTDMTTYGFEVPIWAADFYDFNGYGMGESYDGMLLFLLMDPADRQGWAMATGRFESLYTEDVANALDDELYYYLGRGDYFEGVYNWVLNMDTFFDKGIPFAPDWYPSSPDSFVRSNNASFPRVADRTNVLTDEELEELTRRAEELSDKYGIDVAVCFAGNTYNMGRQGYSDAYYYYNGLGFGEDYDGILALIWTDADEVTFTVSGSVSERLTERNLELLTDGIRDKTDYSEFYKGGVRFLKYLDRTLKTGRTPRTPMVWGIRIVFSAVVGLIVSAIYVGSLKRGMKTVRTAYQANRYLVSGSLGVNAVADAYTHSTTTRVYKPIERSSGGGSSGGTRSGGSSHSSSYHGSSGRSHSGSGRRF